MKHPPSPSESITNEVFRDLGDRFGLRGDFREATPYGSGHINDTFAVTYSQAGTAIRYIFQRINQLIFRDIAGLMENQRKEMERIVSDWRPRCGS